MNIEQIVSPNPSDLLMIIISVRNSNVSEAIWKPFVKLKEYVHRDCSIEDVLKFVKNSYPHWHTLCWKNLEIKRD